MTYDMRRVETIPFNCLHDPILKNAKIQSFCHLPLYLAHVPMPWEAIQPCPHVHMNMTRRGWTNVAHWWKKHRRSLLLFHIAMDKKIWWLEGSHYNIKDSAFVWEMSTWMCNFILDPLLHVVKMSHEMQSTEHIQLYVSAQKGYWFELCRTTYTCATWIITRSYAHVWNVWRSFI
jgi:hypothetical protein